MLWMRTVNKLTTIYLNNKEIVEIFEVDGKYGVTYTASTVGTESDRNKLRRRNWKTTKDVYRAVRDILIIQLVKSEP